MRAIVALRLLLLLVAGGLAVLGVVLGVRDPSSEAGTARYVCPMHPEVKARAPGLCPICRMALEPVNHGSADSGGRAPPGMADIAAVENVRKHKIFDVVRMRSLPFELRELRAPASVDADGLITALFYADQVAAIAPDEHAVFSSTRSPTAVFPAQRSAEPTLPWDASTTQVRFHLNADGARSFRPGEVGWLELERKSRDVLGVPASALLQSPEGPYVLLSRGAMRYERRPVRLGPTYLRQGFAVVLSGLRAHDRVVARAAFFLDADLRLNGNAAEISEAPL